MADVCNGLYCRVRSYLQNSANRGSRQATPCRVRGPTVVAFFDPVTQEELEKDPDTNEALADFEVYAKKVRNPLREAGIEFHELSAHSFRLRLGKRLITFRPAKGVGYYLVEPGKKPRIEYGVMTDADLLKVANEYFGISAK
jgi:hypothetical protein